MASLYEIDQAILECIDMETGELIDPERRVKLQTVLKEATMLRVSCENPNREYLCLPFIRLVFECGKYVGWYRP